jgi:predicted PurR-regulated permease PerM
MPLPPTAHERVPVRTILTTIGLVLLTVLALLFIMAVQQTLTWIVIAAFFAVALTPAANWLERRIPRCPRSLATLLVFVGVALLLIGLVTAFVVPLAQQGTTFAQQLPHLLEDARAGRGPIGGLLGRTHALTYVQEHQDRIRAFATGLTTPAAGLLKGVATGIAGTLTVFVLAFLMVLVGPRLVDSTLTLFEERQAERMRRVAGDCARSITGYITGNLLISVICGVLTFIVLAVFHVPFALLIALFVAIADLIPLIGATLGAAVAALAGFVHSVPAGIAVLIFFVVYQQVENHLLQPIILSRTVQLNPLTVLIAILLAAELAGMLGALLAIPVAGMIQVIVRDVWDHRRGRLKDEPTVGEQEESLEAVPDRRNVTIRPQEGS